MKRGDRVEWEALLLELGWTKSRFAREAGLRETTVHHWKEPPLWAVRWLRAERLMPEEREIRISNADEILRPGKPLLREKVL